MKIFTNKRTIQMIMAILVLLTLFVFITPNYVQADLGGTLIKPVKKLAAICVDAVLWLVQAVVTDTSQGLDITVKSDANDVWDDKDDIPYAGLLSVTPDAIFSNKIGILNPDFINPIDTTHQGIDHGKYNTSLIKLRQTIQNWYVGLRNLALVGLLSVLVYIGIRIILCSAAAEKAKYKQMAQYWLTSLVLLFVLQYIMAFTFLMARELTKIFVGNSGSANIVLLPESGTLTIEDTTDQTNYETFLKSVYNNTTPGYSSGSLTQIPTLQQFARLNVSLSGMKGIAYLIIYIALVAFTAFFFVVYTARVIKLAFLTMMAPLITLTYAIDKISDGQSQAFNIWIKEFIYNVLIQPFHLLIYTLLGGMSLDLAASNPIFAIVALGFIIPAEKMLKKMFGFDKAPGSGAFSGAAAGSMVANAISKAGSKAGGGKAKAEGGKGGDGASGEKPTRTVNDSYGAYGESENNGDDNHDREDNPELEDREDNPELENREPPPELNDQDREDFNDYLNSDEYQESLEEEQEKRAAEQEAWEKEQENERIEQDYRDKLDPNSEEAQYLAQEEWKNDQEEQEKNAEEEAKLREQNNKEDEEEHQEEPKQLSDKEKKKQERAQKRAAFLSGVGRGAGAVGKSLERGIQNKAGWTPKAGFKKNVGNMVLKGAKTLGKGVLHGGTRALLGGGAALLAGSAALVSGDPKAVIGAMAVGARTGSNVGGRLANKAEKGLGSVSDTFNRGKLRH